MGIGQRSCFRKPSALISKSLSFISVKFWSTARLLTKFYLTSNSNILLLCVSALTTNHFLCCQYHCSWNVLVGCHRKNTKPCTAKHLAPSSQLLRKQFYLADNKRIPDRLHHARVISFSGVYNLSMLSLSILYTYKSYICKWIYCECIHLFKNIPVQAV